MTKARTTTTPSGVPLCPLGEIAVARARGFVLEMRETRFHGFVVRTADRVRGYVDRCPHAGLSLAKQLDDYLTPDASLITCSWHGALFEVDTGACVGGPCAGQGLTAWPVLVDEGWIKTGLGPADTGA